MSACGDSELERFESALEQADQTHYLLQLYVVGATSGSQRAIANLTRICDEELGGRYRLEVIDVYQRPDLAARENVIATPTLIRRLPEPLARLVGDMSDRERIVVGLDLHVTGSVRPAGPDQPG